MLNDNQFYQYTCASYMQTEYNFGPSYTSFLESCAVLTSPFASQDGSDSGTMGGMRWTSNNGGNQATAAHISIIGIHMRSAEVNGTAQLQCV